MITELKKKEITTVKEMLDIFTAKIGGFKTDMETIDRKYREMAENEKKELKQNLAGYKSQQKAWQKMFNTFDEADIKEALGDDYYSNPDTTDSADEEEEKVVDTIFPENNEEEVKEAGEVEEDEQPDADSLAETKQGEPQEEVREGFPEGTEGSPEENPWPDDADSVSENEETVESDDAVDEFSGDSDEDGDDDWPEIPEEWK